MQGETLHVREQVSPQREHKALSGVTQQTREAIGQRSAQQGDKDDGDTRPVKYLLIAERSVL